MNTPPATAHLPLEEEAPQPVMDAKLLWLLTITAGAAVANLYYSQPLLADIAKDFTLTAGQAGFVGTLAQIGYGLGLLLIVPLGDSKDRRSMLTLLLLLEAVALLGITFAFNVAWLGVASFAVGLLTIVPQVIVPFSASLASDNNRARIVGTILSGMLVGILLARVVSGFIGDVFGWRAMYGIAAGLMVLLALILWRVLPKQPTTAGM